MVTIFQFSRILLIVLGVVLLLFGSWDLIVPRARFLKSSPPAGATILQAPSSVAVEFSHKLQEDSHIDVTSTIKLLPNGETEFLDGSSVVMRSGIDKDDPSGKSLSAQLRPDLHKGLYFINWTITTSKWKTVTNGETAFGVGMAVPDHITRGMGGMIRERNYQYRGRRAALVGGLIMVILAAFLKPSFQGQTPTLPRS